MKKIILFFGLIALMVTGCSQIQSNDNLSTDWLSSELTENFAEHNFSVDEINAQEIGYAETKALGFDDSGVHVLMYDENHEVYGNEKEFGEAISRYSSDEFYGEILLNEMQVHPEILLQYTKTSVMASHGSMKKEYFFTLPNEQMLKVRVSFPADPEIDDNTQKELIESKVTEIHEILISSPFPS